MIGHGDGWPPVFAVAVREHAPGEYVKADLRNPANFHAIALDASATRPVAGEDRAIVAHEQLRAALDHHRPPTTIRIDGGGNLDVVASEAVARHESCTRDLMQRSAESLAATTDHAFSRERWLEEARMWASAEQAAVTIPALLLRLVNLRPGAFVDGAAPEGPPAEPTRSDRATQITWRAEQVRAHGRAFRLEIDLAEDGHSAGAGICRSLEVPGAQSHSSNHCMIEGVLDRRDGWPMTISIRREVNQTGGSTKSRSVVFSRLTPLEGFVTPENPCADSR